MGRIARKVTPAKAAAKAALRGVSLRFVKAPRVTLEGKRDAA